MMLTVCLHNNTMMLLVSNVLETAPPPPLVTAVSDTRPNCSLTDLGQIVSLSECRLLRRQ
jgi:hypothetical protein